MLKSIYLSLLISLSSTLAFSQVSNDQKIIENLVIEFLAKVDSKEMHNQFWDQGLVYTSSSGERFGKEKIMGGFDNQEKEEEKTTSPFTAENIDIRIIGQVAIINFTLVFDTDTEKLYYLNSGVLHKKNSTWSVINWHATKKALDK